MTTSGSASETLASYVVGTGPRATVLMHGFLGSNKNLRTLARGWVERDPTRRLLVVDLPSHGDSPALPDGGTLDEAAAMVLSAAHKAGFAPPLSLVGHSLGGRVALAGARAAPADVDQVVLLDIAPGPIDLARSESQRVLNVLRAAPDDTHDRRVMRAWLVEHGLSEGLSDWVLMNLRADADGRYRWRIDREAMGRLHARWGDDDLWPVVQAHPTHVRCARGARSHYVSDDDIARFHALGCDVVTFPEAGHYLHVDALAALVDWLARA